jgi:hypothetical protein
MLVLVVPLGKYVYPGSPSEHPSLTLQALIQVIHTFIKQVAFHLAACFWWRHLKYLGYKANGQEPKCSHCFGRVVAI